MKATDFANYFDFDIQRCDTGYEVFDLQVCFDTRYIQDISELVDCFDSMLDDYVFDIEDYGFEYDEDSPLTETEQAIEWMELDAPKFWSTKLSVARCLAGQEEIENNVD